MSHAEAPGASALFGDPRLPNRFWSRVRATDSTCWIWVGARLRSGYGSFRWEGGAKVAHRVAYEVLVEPIPPDRQLDHLCRTRSCCNPNHVEPVTQRENLLRGVSLPAANARKTHCDRGHEYTPENTYIRPSAPTHRACRTCLRITRRRFYERTKGITSAT